MKKDFVKKTLSNGIDVYIYSDKNMKRVVASYNVKYGSLGYYDRFYFKEKAYAMPPAMAHFLEHTLVETAKRGNMLLKYRDKNYEMNALTYHELTTFYFVGIEDAMESLKELIEMVDDPGFNSENIEKVKLAIVEEAAGKTDDKYRQGYNMNKENSFAAFHSVHESYNTLGTEETTRGITIDDVQTCYDAYYNDENKFLVLGGNLDVDKTIDYLESIFSGLKRHPNEMRPMDYGDMLPVRKEYDEMFKPVANDHVIVSYKIRNDWKMSNILIDLLLLIYLRMKFSSTTEFVTKMVTDKVLIGSIDYVKDFFQGTITLTFAADVLDIDEFLKRIDNRLNIDDLDEYTFELIKKNLKVHELSKMDFIYRSIKNFPLSIDFTEKMYALDVVDEVTLDDIKKFISEIDWSIKTVTVIKKEK